MDGAYLNQLATTLRSRPDKVEALQEGLTDSEVARIEQRFGFTFPPDLRAVLQFMLPIGKSFPNWRSGAEEKLRSRLAWPLEGMVFDVECADLWWEEWGPKPGSEAERFALVKSVVESAPALIPIYAHRFLPTEPLEAGNPVFSVYQTDIIHYGKDLADYFHQEFKAPLPVWAAKEPRRIRFWTEWTGCEVREELGE